MYYIYEIFNKVTGRKYIGQTINHQKRYKTHMNNLKKGVHTERLMQRDYILYGEDSFDYRLLDFTETYSDAIKKEKTYMILNRTYEEEHGYNSQDSYFNKYQNTRQPVNFQNYFYQKAKENNDLICSPIYKWLDSDVWEFIHERGMKYNPLYDKGFKRVGCIGCPMSTKQIQELEMYPKYKEQFIRTFAKLLEMRKQNGKDDSKGHWTDAESLYRWWVQDDSIPGQMDIFDFIDKEETEG